MSSLQPKKIIKTLSKDDIHDVLDQFGTENKDNIVFANDDGDGVCLDGNSQQTLFYVDKTARFTLQEEWNLLFKHANFVDQLKLSALGGSLGTKTFRSVCWRVFWECLSENADAWTKEVVEQRSTYKHIRNKYVIDPYDEKHDEIDLSEHHPLSLAEDSAWNKYFQDNELRSTITQDIDRLCPEVEFFKKDNIKSIILHVLFCFARENPQVSYKQGMHEVLATLVFVMMVSCVAVQDCKEPLSDEIKTINNIEYIEHDTYALFCNVMETLEPWFTNLKGGGKPNLAERQKQHLPNDRRMFVVPHETELVTAISKKLNKLQNFMLKRYDVALYEHLRRIEITPQLYGIRWLRLLFGREFSLSRLLILWDALFADGVSLALIDYVYLAMLINLRGVLLENDFNTCLTYLMKYPPNTDTKYILKRALELRHNKPGAAPNKPFIDQQHQSRSRSPRPAVHPVRNRLTETKQQQYANALGSGGDMETKKKKPSSLNNQERSNFYSDHVEDQQDGIGAFVETASSQPSQKLNTAKSLVGSQISNLKTKVGSPQQIINRISKSIKQPNSDVNTIIEDHARLQNQVGELQAKLDNTQNLCHYCGEKMNYYLGILQDRLLSSEEFSDEISILSVAGLKQVRDILKDGPELRNADDYGIDFNDIDRHIKQASTNAEQNAVSTSVSQLNSLHPDVDDAMLESHESVSVTDAVDFDQFEPTQTTNQSGADFEDCKGLSPLSSTDVNSPEIKRKDCYGSDTDELVAVNANCEGVENLSLNEPLHIDPLSHLLTES